MAYSKKYQIMRLLFPLILEGSQRIEIFKKIYFQN